MIARRYAPLLFALILSGVMTLLVSGLSTWRAVGLAQAFAQLWLGAWLTSWSIAFPLVLVIAPLTRRLVEKLAKD
jgi:membrane protein implicated in regulation of membrane protease activity